MSGLGELRRRRGLRGGDDAMEVEDLEAQVNEAKATFFEDAK